MTTKRTGRESLADSIQQPQLPGVVPALEGKVAGVAVTGKTKMQSKETDVHTFSGQVLTADDQPLSNAELRIVNTNQSFMTDQNGRFSIPAADSVIEVDVNFIGHNTQRFKIDGNSTMNRLLLSPASAELSDVVVVGYGRSTRATRNTIRLNNAEPNGGWEAFHGYIAASKNKRLSHTPPRETEITFKVTGNNKLSEFRVSRSISPQHDAEVIRLVKTGPKWKVIKGRKAQVRVVIRL
jgi:hypothetical protein